MRIILFVLVIIKSNLVFSQSTIEGKILEAESNEPIAFANIFIEGSSVGTTSNEDGMFQLHVPKELNGKLVIISCVGYAVKSNQVELLALNKELIIFLEPVTYSLSEVVIEASKEVLTDPEEIVTRAISRIKDNYQLTPVLLSGFYRQAHLEDKNYTRLIEAAISIYDPGYNKPLTDIKINIDGLRRSYDARRLDSKAVLALSNSKEMSHAVNELDQKYHSLGKFVRANPIRKSLVKDVNEMLGALGPEFVDKHDFKLDSTLTLGEDLVYRIKILPTRKSDKIGKWGRDFLPVGWLYVRNSDFGIIEIEYAYIANPKKTAAKVYTGSGIYFKNILRFRDYNGKLQLSYFSTFSMDQVGTFSQMDRKMQTGFSEGFFYVSKQFIVTSIVTDTPSRTSWNDDLYGNKITYDPSFWKNYTVLLETTQEAKLRQDLEKKVSLEEQFKNN